MPHTHAITLLRPNSFKLCLLSGLSLLIFLSACTSESRHQAFVSKVVPLSYWPPIAGGQMELHYQPQVNVA
ncbi:MAG TPA: hypothetical protein PLB55_23860, partial [Prosthecobacter sp.]|nr:hypothetical protein [Prosthecobacter sp.]